MEERARASEPSNEESIHLIRERWSKLQQNLFKKGEFDISKIPDIYDAIKYAPLCYSVSPRMTKPTSNNPITSPPQTTPQSASNNLFPGNQTS